MFVYDLVRWLVRPADRPSPVPWQPAPRHRDTSHTGCPRPDRAPTHNTRPWWCESAQNLRSDRPPSTPSTNCGACLQTVTYSAAHWHTVSVMRILMFCTFICHYSAELQCVLFCYTDHRRIKFNWPEWAQISKTTFRSEPRRTSESDCWRTVLLQQQT